MPPTSFKKIPYDIIQSLKDDNKEEWNKWHDEQIQESKGEILFEINDETFNDQYMSDMDMSYISFCNCTFKRVEIHNGNLTGSKISYCKFANSIIEKSNLSQTSLASNSFIETFLNTVNFTRADLRGVNFEDATLSNVNFAMSNTSGMKIPKNNNIFSDTISNVEKASKNARGLFYILMGLCLFTLITILTTTDLQLLLKNKPISLPIFGVKIPVMHFYMSIPFGLLGVWLYFQVYLWDVYRLLVKLPNNFPDGALFSEKLFPWIFIGLVECIRESGNKPLEWIETSKSSIVKCVLAFVLAWLLPFLTLFLTFGWFVPASVPFFNYTITSIITLFIILSYFTIAMSVYFIKHGKPKKYSMSQKLVSTGCICILFFCSGLFARYLNSDDYTNWINSLNIINQEIPLEQTCGKWKDGTWKITKRKTGNLNGANLSFSNLKQTNLYAVLLKDSFLLGTNLRESDLRLAKLQNSLLYEANLWGAKLYRANMNKAHLCDADLEKADLESATLEGANLANAHLRKTNLTHANLRNSILSGANLTEAVLTDANLKYAEYNSKKYSGVFEHNPTKFPKGFDPKAHGMIDVCDTPGTCETEGQPTTP